MKQFRVLISLLLLVTLPVYGMAGLSVDTKPPCPMQMSADSTTHHPCCADRHDGSNPCKPGQECKTSSLFQPGAVKASPVVPALHFSAMADDLQPLPEHNHPIWHPPRA